MSEYPISQEEMRSALLAAIQDAGGQKAWAQANSISPQYVCDCLKGRREIGPAIARVFGYEPITVYVRSHLGSSEPSEFVKRIATSLASMVTEWVDGGRTPDEDWRPGLEAIIAGRLNRFLAQRQSEEPALAGDTGKDHASLTPKTGPQDFEAKAREIIRAELDDNSDEAVWDGENATLCQAIASALSEAYEAGRDLVQTDVQQDQAPSGHQSSCWVIERLRTDGPYLSGVSNNPLSQQWVNDAEEAIHFCRERDARKVENILPVAVRVSNREAQVTAPLSQQEFETKSIIDHPYYNPRTSDDER